MRGARTVPAPLGALGYAPGPALLVGAAILVGTVAAVLIRPLRLHEAWWACLGAGLMAAFGFVGLDDAVGVVQETAGVLVFLVGVLVAGAVADRAGVFALAALWTARRTGTRATRLFVGLYLVGAMLTTFLSLDATAVILPPIVLAMVRRGGLPALPFVFLCAHVANTASLWLPVSNLTNLLVQARFDLPFWQFARVMALPATLAAGANLALLFLFFRRQLVGALDVEALEIQVRVLSRSPFLRWSLALLGLTLVGFGVAGALGYPLWPVALAGGGALAILAVARKEVRPAFFVRGISWALVPFVVGLFLVIRGAEHSGVAQQVLTVAVGRTALAGSLAVPPGGPGGHGGATPHLQEAAEGTWVRTLADGVGFSELASVAALAAAGSNLVNNVPMTLLGMSAAQAAGPLGPYALLLGVNVGPDLSIIGSLATMLVLGIVRQQGVEVRGWEYLKVGLVAMPVSLGAAVLGLWLAAVLGLP